MGNYDTDNDHILNPELVYFLVTRAIWTSSSFQLKNLWSCRHCMLICSLINTTTCSIWVYFHMHASVCLTSENRVYSWNNYTLRCVQTAEMGKWWIFILPRNVCSDLTKQEAVVKTQVVNIASDSTSLKACRIEHANLQFRNIIYRVAHLLISGLVCSAVAINTVKSLFKYSVD